MPAAGYTTREVAKLAGMPAHRVRAYARAGLVGPAGPGQRAARLHWRFDFRDLLVLRMAGRLLTSGFAPHRVQRALAALRRHIAAKRPLSGAQVYSDAGHMVASDGAIVWDPESGQCLLRFGAKRLAASGAGAAPVPLPRQAPPPTAPPPPIAALSDTAGQGQADVFFDRALQLEESKPEQAYGLYLKALACDPEHVEAMINVGRLCSAHGDSKRAAAYFRQAVRSDEAHPVAHFNLAVTLQDLGDSPGAIAAYQAALVHDPHFADAHYNLASLLHDAGDHDEAERHLKAYRRLSDSRA